MAALVQIGVDPGQRVDPCALAVAEVAPAQGQAEYLVRFLERMPLGTPYPAVADRLATVYTKLKNDGYRVTVYLDATGVGAPVLDLVRKARVPAVAVYLTGGEKETREGGEIRLAKMLLVSRLQVLLQQRRVKLPNTAEAQALIDELLNFELRRTDAANLQAGAFRTGTHDDLAIALGLATRPALASTVIPMPQASRWDTDARPGPRPGADFYRI